MGDILTLADGTTASVSDTYGEQLDEPVIVYNFEVQEFHTYYVTDTGVLVHNASVDIHGNGTCGESFYRTMSSKEYERLKENDYHLSKRPKGSSELKVTRNQQYVVSDLSQRKGQKYLYDEIIRFDVKEGIQAGLESMGGVMNAPVKGYEDYPVFQKGMVQIKQERATKSGEIPISFGLGTSPGGLAYFNQQIESVYVYRNSGWVRLK